MFPDIGNFLSNAVSDVGHFLGVNQKPQQNNNTVAPARTSPPVTNHNATPVRTTPPGQPRFTPVQAPKVPSIAPAQTQNPFAHITPAQIGTQGKGQAVVSKAGLKATPGAIGGALLGGAKAAYDVASGIPKAAAAGYDAAGNKITHQNSSSSVSKALAKPDTAINQKVAKLSPTAKSAASAGNISANLLSVLGGGESAAGTEGSRVLDAATNASKAVKSVAKQPFENRLTPLNQTGGIKGSPFDSAGDIARKRVDQLKASSGTEPKPPVPNRTTIGSQKAPQVKPPTEPTAVTSQKAISNRPSADNNIRTKPSQVYTPKAIAPNGQKLSRFANKTVQNSDQVDLATKKLVDEKAVSYTPQAVKTGQDTANNLYGTKNLKQSALEVNRNLDKKTGTISRQDVFNAHKVAERLQKSNDIQDKATAADIYSRLSEHHTAAGQQIQAAAALAKQTPEGMLYSATKTLKDKGVIKDSPEKILENSKAGGKGASSKVFVQTNGNDKAVNNVIQAIDDYTAATKDMNLENMSRAEADKQSLAYQKVVDTVNRQIPRTKGQAALGLWRSGLLTGPETAAKVAVSHAITAPLELATKPVSAAIDKATSLITGRRGYTFTPGDLKAGVEGYKRGLSAANTKLRTGLDLPGTGGFERKMGESSRETKYEQIPTRLHASIAKPNFAAEHEMSLRSQAYAEAVNQGLKGAERDKFIQNFVANPSKGALETAQREAEHFTNQQKSLLGKGASAVQSVPYVGTVLAPFTRIPGAIGVKGLADWTPLGLGKGVMKIVRGIRDGNFDQRGFSQDIGRSITGTGIAVTGYELMAAGRLTLAAPTDPKEKALWEQEGRQKNSIYVGGTVTKNKDGTTSYKGGKWISLNAFGPAGITIGLGGGFRKAIEQGKNVATAIVQAAATGGKVLTDQPYLKGISGAANALNDPSQYAQTFLNSTVGSVVPALSSQIARGTDTKQRAYNPSVTGTVKGEIPGLREGQPALLDTFGKAIPSGNGGSIAGDINGTINPFYPSSARNQDNPATKELQRLYTANGSQGAPAFAQPQKTLTINGQKVKLTPEQMDRYVGASGPLIQSGIANLVKNPDYQKLSDDQKTAQINSVITGARTAAKVSQFGSNPKTLTGSERTAILSPSELGKDVQLPGLKLATGIDPANKAELSKVYSMTSTAKTAYLKDPANKYQYDVATATNDYLNGKYDSVQWFNKQADLSKQKVTSQYSQNINELYGMSKTKLTDYLSGRSDSGDIQKQLVSLDNALYNAGVTTSLKYKSGVTSSGSSGSSAAKNGPIKAPTNTLDAMKALDSILRGTQKIGKVSTPKAPKLVSYKASPIKVSGIGKGSKGKSSFGRSSVKMSSKGVKQPRQQKSEKLPKFLKPPGASISTSKKSGQRIKLTV